MILLRTDKRIYGAAVLCVAHRPALDGGQIAGHGLPRAELRKSRGCRVPQRFKLFPLYGVPEGLANHLAGIVVKAGSHLFLHKFLQRGSEIDIHFLP